MNKNRALEIAETMSNDDVSYFMGNYAYDNKSNSKEWHSKFVEYLKNDYTGTEKTFRDCVDVFNKYYWISHIV